MTESEENQPTTPVPRTLLYDIYNVLRRIELSAMWDEYWYDDAVQAKYALGEIMFPDA